LPITPDFSGRSYVVEPHNFGENTMVVLAQHLTYAIYALTDDHLFPTVFNQTRRQRQRGMHVSRFP
jgi:hypothetical protein